MTDELDADRERRAMAYREQQYLVRGMPYFKCPDCGAVSHQADDIANNYCFRCHAFKGDQ